MNQSLRAILIGLALTLALPAGVAVASVSPLGPPAKPDPGPELRVGVELIAVRDVNLRAAIISKGSRVRVVKIVRKGDKPTGAPLAVSLELKDGHVLSGVAYRKVRDNFKKAPASK